MKKTDIVFTVILSAMAVLAVVSACLGSTIHVHFLSELMALSTIGYLLGKIMYNLQKIVSLLEFRTLGLTLDVLTQIKRNIEAQEMVKSKNTETCKAPASEKEQKEPTTDSTK